MTPPSHHPAHRPWRRPPGLVWVALGLIGLVACGLAGTAHILVGAAGLDPFLTAPTAVASAQALSIPVTAAGTQPGISYVDISDAGALSVEEGSSPWHWDPIGPGTYHATAVLRRTDAVQPVHVVRIDRQNPFVRLASTLAHGTAGGLQPVSAQALARSGPGAAVVAAINGDFFYSSPVIGLPVGLHMEDGELITSPAGPATTATFGVTADGRPVIGAPRMEARVWLVEEPGTLPPGDGRDGFGQGGGAPAGTSPWDPVPTSWAIDLVNRPLSGLGLALYTPRVGAFTPPVEGTAVIVSGVAGPLLPGVTYTGTVAGREYGTRAKPLTLFIPPDGLVLAARGPAEEFLDLLPPGATLQWEVRLAPPFDGVRDAVSGRPVLVSGGQPVPLDTRDSLIAQRHPRTAIGFNGRDIFLVTVDGRRPGQADGMNLLELQELMLRLGATEALNLDGGGSTTMVVRPPGLTDPEVVNFPSDGRERPVTNGLVVLSTAPLGNLARVIVRPAAPVALVGSLVPIHVLGQDEHYNPIPVTANDVTWSARGDAGRVGAAGTLSAHRPGTVVIEAFVGDFSTQAPVTVVDTVAAITLTPDTITLESGESFTVQARAFDEAGRPVWTNPWQFTWTSEGRAARVDAGGQVTGVQPGEAVIMARLGDVAGSARVTVDRPPLLLSSFERAGVWLATSVRARATLTLSDPGEPVYAGTSAAKLTYDLRNGGAGTAAAYVQAVQPIPIPGRPRAIGLWVYGDASGHWLRGNYLDGEGNRHVMDFTLVRGLDWTGWRYVEAPIDPAAPLPISFERVYVTEFDPARQGSGVLYFDHLMALYGPRGQ